LLSNSSTASQSMMVYVACTSPALPSPTLLSLHEVCVQVQEPMTAYHQPRTQLPAPLFGFVPRAYYQWQGNITLRQFMAVPDNLRGPMCPHCTYTVRYKIYKGHLYRDSPQVSGSEQEVRRQARVAAAEAFTTRRAVASAAVSVTALHCFLGSL
jgi:hypothetical protein